MAEFPIIRNYDDLVAALVFQKNALGISDATLEDICGLTRAHVSKVFGRARTKAIGKWLLGILLEGLALELVPRINPEALNRLKSRHQPRNERQVRTCQPVSQALLDQCRPIIMRELTQNATIASVKARRRQAQRRQANGTGANGHAP
jgi:hypothetical protein